MIIFGSRRGVGEAEAIALNEMGETTFSILRSLQNVSNVSNFPT